MANAWSQSLPYTCYEVAHTWSPSCMDANLRVFAFSFVQSFKIYGVLYLLAAILGRKKKGYFLKRFIPETARSALFLSTNVALFVGTFCLWRRLFPCYLFYNAFLVATPVSTLAYHIERSDRHVLGAVYLPTSGIVPGACASLSAIVLERKGRRGMLALYLLNLATETAFKMAVSRDMIKPVPHGEVLLFSVVMAVYVYLYKKNALEDGIKKMLSYFLGRNELPPEAHESLTGPGPTLAGNTQSEVSPIHSTDQSSAGASGKRPGVLVSYLPKSLKNMISLWRQGPKHRLCRHHFNCLASSVESGARLFVIGYLVQAVMKLVRALSSIFRKPRALFDALKHRDNLNLGLFLGSFTALLRICHCLLRWIRDKDTPVNGLISGFVAGWSMMWYKSTTVVMWIASKLAEIMYFKGVDAGIVPFLKHGDILVYTLSTAFVLHAAVFEPHNMRPAYWKFLLGLTDQKFGMMNRKLLDVYGTHASKLYPDYWPNYDKRFTNL